MKALFWLASFALAQDLTYTRLPAGELVPSARVDGTLAYDSADRLYLFGGQADAPLNDLWTYSLAQRRWQRLSPTGDLPAPPLRPHARLGYPPVPPHPLRRTVPWLL